MASRSCVLGLKACICVFKMDDRSLHVFGDYTERVHTTVEKFTSDVALRLTRPCGMQTNPPPPPQIGVICLILLHPLLRFYGP